MQEFHGDLLIGGMRLKDVVGEVEGEMPCDEAKECSLSGHLHLPPDQLNQLELHREYRIELVNGQAAQVVLSRIDAAFSSEVLADFEPPHRKPRPK